MTRLWLGAVFLLVPAVYGQAVQEPPEEDVNVETVKEYTFNPLQAVKEIKVGAYYHKKGSYKAAARRFEEALKWDPNSADAYLRLGDARAKLGDAEAAKTAYSKYLELEPDSKEAKSVRSKIEKLDEAKPRRGESGANATPRRSS